MPLSNCSVTCNKAALLHDVTDDNRLNVLAMTETCIRPTRPMLLFRAPPWLLVCRPARPRHWSTTQATTVDVGDYGEFKLLMVKLLAAGPSLPSSLFTDQLSDLCYQLVLLGMQFVVVGDFNVPGDATGQRDQCVTDMFARC